MPNPFRQKALSAATRAALQRMFPPPTPEPLPERLDLGPAELAIDTDGKRIFMAFSSPTSGIALAPNDAAGVGRQLIELAKACGFEESRIILPPGA